MRVHGKGIEVKDSNIAMAVKRFERWLGLGGSLAPEHFVVSDILRGLCNLEQLEVAAVNSRGGSRMWFSSGDDRHFDQWLWMLEIGLTETKLSIRTVAPSVSGRKFLVSLLTETNTLQDAAQLVKWWTASSASPSVVITTELPNDAELLVDLFSQIDGAVRETVLN